MFAGICIHFCAFTVLLQQPIRIWAWHKKSQTKCCMRSPATEALSIVAIELQAPKGDVRVFTRLSDREEVWQVRALAHGFLLGLSVLGVVAAAGSGTVASQQPLNCISFWKGFIAQCFALFYMVLLADLCMIRPR